MDEPAVETSIPEVRPFRRDTIRAFLEAEDLKYLRDRDDDFLVIFGATEKSPDLHVWLMPEGREKDIYSIFCMVDVGSAADLTKWTGVANDWNRAKRWPKAYISADNDAIRLTLESSMGLGPGIHQALFDFYSRATLSGIVEFFDWYARTGDDKGSALPETPAVAE